MAIPKANFPANKSLLLGLIFILFVVSPKSVSGISLNKSENIFEADTTTIVTPQPPVTPNQPIEPPVPGQTPNQVAKTIQVTEVYNLRAKNGNADDRNKAGIEDIIVVKVKGLKTLVNWAKCLDENGVAIPGCTNNKQEIRLFIEGRMIKDIVPESGAPQPEDGELQYHLQRNVQNSEAWADILGGPRFDEYFFVHPVKISVGLENDYPVDSSVEKFNLVRMHRTWFWGCLIGFLIFIFLLYKLVKQSDIVRDRGVDASVINIIRPKGSRAPYSLGRVQMAIWFCLVIFSFLFIWLVTNAHEISAGILILLGIGAGTALSAAVIDNSKGEGLLKETFDLIAQEPVLQAEVTQLRNAVAAIPSPANILDLQALLNSKSVELNKLQTQIKNNKTHLTPLTSQGFIKDILSDINGVSFHRYQLFIWTFVLALVFLYSVWHKLAMINFPTELLALQGLTAGTYLGFKIPEKQA